MFLNWTQSRILFVHMESWSSNDTLSFIYFSNKEHTTCRRLFSFVQTYSSCQLWNNRRSFLYLPMFPWFYSQECSSIILQLEDPGRPTVGLLFIRPFIVQLRCHRTSQFWHPIIQLFKSRVNRLQLLSSIQVTMMP